MVMKPEPLAGAIRAAREKAPGARTILMTPQGRVFTQAVAAELAGLPGLILVCGRYEGVDDRLCGDLIDEELSIGDYVLTGGELPAMVVIDAVTRLIPGALGGEDSAARDSFSAGRLEHAHYTRPPVFEASEVPGVLLTGHHRNIERWRLASSLHADLRQPAGPLAGPAADGRGGGSAPALARGHREASRRGARGGAGRRAENRAAAEMPRLYLALVHYPVVNRRGEVIASALTNLDLHDIARAAKTFGVQAYFRGHPAGRPAGFRRADRGPLDDGPGCGTGARPPSGHGTGAGDGVDCGGHRHHHGHRGRTAAGGGHLRPAAARPPSIARRCAPTIAGGRRCLLVFGTAWGLAPEAIAGADRVLAPIAGTADYNHLAVRSAAAIVLDPVCWEERHRVIA